MKRILISLSLGLLMALAVASAAAAEGLLQQEPWSRSSMIMGSPS